MIDSHVHVGQFFDIYTTPGLLSNEMKEVGVDYYAVSSTTMCDEDYEKVLYEIRELIRLDGAKVLPVLWVTPNLIIEDKESLFLNSEIAWKMIKIHPQLHPDFWQENEECMDYVVRLCQELRIPLLIHTGERNSCEVRHFVPIIERHPSQIFVLAHGRPISETIVVMERYPNVWVDTAFMPVDHMVKLASAGLTDRILWGTDVPINKYFFKDNSTSIYYKERIMEFSESIDDATYNLIFNLNAMKLFDISVR